MQIDSFSAAKTRILSVKIISICTHCTLYMWGKLKIFGIFQLNYIKSSKPNTFCQDFLLQFLVKRCWQHWSNCNRYIMLSVVCIILWSLDFKERRTQNMNESLLAVHLIKMYLQLRFVVQTSLLLTLDNRSYNFMKKKVLPKCNWAQKSLFAYSN